VELTIGMSDDTGLIRVVGEVDANTAPELRDAAIGLLKDGVHSLVIDCERVSFMDSAGLTALIDAHTLASDQRGALVVRRPTELVNRLLRITGLDAELRIDEVEQPG